MNMMHIMKFRNLLRNVSVITFFIIEIPKNPIFIRNSHTIKMHSLVRVLIANVKKLIDNIITHSILNSRRKSVIVAVLHFQKR